MKAALELLKNDLEHYGNCEGELDGISFTIVAHMLRVFIKRIEVQEGVPGAGRPFNIGEQTMARVFRPTAITNVSDLQTVFDAVEKALTAPAWKEIEWDKRINFPTDENMVLIRKSNGRRNDNGKPCYNLDMAYKTISNTWLTANSQPVGSFEEWCEIPK